MANDLVVNLALDYSQYQQGLQSSIAQNAKFSSSVKVMESQIKQAQNSIRNSNSLQSGTSRFDGGMRVGRIQSQANLAGEQANTRVLSAQMSDTSLQVTLLATGLEKLQQEQIQLATSNAQLAASVASAEHQEESLWVAVQKSDQAMLQAQASVKQLANQLGSAEIRTNQLATALANEQANTLRSRSANVLLKDSLASVTLQKQREKTTIQQTINSIMQDRQATIDAAAAKRFLAQSYKEGAITSKEYNNALRASAAGAGRSQAAISQLVFAVDDAATVYGTTGLSGAVRAAGNNLTMFASLAGGPWGLGIAVAASAATQLYLAFSKGDEKVDTAAEKLTKYKQASDDATDSIRRMIEFRYKLRDLDSEGGAGEAAKVIGDLNDEKAILDEQVAFVEKRINEKQRTIAQSDIIRQSTSQTFGKQTWGSAVASMFGMPGGEIAGSAVRREFNKFADTKSAGLPEKVQHDQEVLNRKVAERNELENKITLAQKERNKLLETAKNLTFATGREMWHNMQKQAGAQREQIEQENRSVAKAMAQRATDVRYAISDELDPTHKDGQKRTIAAELQSRYAVIETINGSVAERQTLRRQAEETAARKMAELDAKPAQGPSGFEQGSKESADLVRRAMLGAPLQKDKSEQHLSEVKEYLKQINATSKQQRDYEKKLLDNQPIPINKL